MAGVCKRIDELYRNSDYPTRTQTEEAFGKMFSEMLGDLKNAIYWIGAAVVVSLIFVAGNAMAMAMRERTTEVAVLKAIGFNKRLVLVHRHERGRAGRRPRGRTGRAGLQGSFRLCRHHALHGRLPAVFLCSAGISRFDGTVWSSLLIGFLSGVFPADARGQCVGHRRTQEGDLGTP